MDAVMDAITTQVTALTTNGTTLIGAAVGLSAIFFGAKFLWSKFKSMAK